MQIATLGLRIINEAAVRALDVTSAKLDEMGQKGEQNAAKLTASSQRISTALGRQQQQVQSLGRQYSQVTSGEVSNAVAWYDKTYGSATKATGATEKLTTAAGHSATGFGRLNYSLGSMLSRLSGTSPALERVGIVLGNLGVGGLWTATALIGIAAIGGAWALMSGHFTDAAERARAAVKKLTDEVTASADAMGTLSVTWAKANLLQVSAEASGSGGVGGFFSGQHAHAMEASLKVGLGGGTRAQQQAAYDASMTGAVVQAQAVLKQANANAAHDQADALATLITGNAKDHEARVKGIALLKQDQADLAKLAGHWDDASTQKRVKLTNDIRTVGDALNPKKRKQHEKKPVFLDTITSGSALIQQSVEMSVRWYDKEVQAADKAIAARAAFLGKASLKSVKPELLANGSPAMKAFDQAVSAARDTQDRITTRNAINAAHGKGPINEGPGTVMDTLRKSAVAAGGAVADALQAAGVHGDLLHTILEKVNKDLKDIGANAPKAKQSSIFDTITSGLRTAGDAANLFGGPRAGQYANALNTGANAIDNVKAARAAGPISLANIIPDAQAVLSIVSLGKQIFSLGGVSHDAARAIQEASASVRNSIAILNASVNHDALGGLLAQAQAAKDALKSQINSELSGKKREKERNAALASADAAYAVQQQQIRDKYAVTVQDFFTSTAAATDRAKGLNYQASLLDLQVQQRDAMQALVDQGILLANGGGTAQQKAAYIAEQGLLAAQRTALATESLTQLANAPTGFFAERYFGQFSTPAAFPGISPPSTSTGAAGGGSTFNAPINININGANKDPAAIAKETVAEIRKLGNQYGGMGTTIADTMELMS